MTAVSVINKVATTGSGYSFLRARSSFEARTRTTAQTRTHSWLAPLCTCRRRLIDTSGEIRLPLLWPKVGMLDRPRALGHRVLPLVHFIKFAIVYLLGIFDDAIKS